MPTLTRSHTIATILTRDPEGVIDRDAVDPRPEPEPTPEPEPEPTEEPAPPDEPEPIPDPGEDEPDQPDDSWTKAQIQAHLDDNQIEWTTDMTKATLLSLVP